MCQVRRILSAPFIGLLYVVLLPFGFFFVLFSAGVNVLLRTVSAMLTARA